MNCLINWMTGINRLNIFVNFSDKILPHVPTWRRNWSWFRCEPALFCSCSRLTGGIFWRKGTAVGWRQETPSANESVVSTTAFRKILAFFEINWVCWTECKILTFRSHSPLKSAEKTEHCRSLCNEYSHKTVTRALRRGAAGFGISLTLRSFSCLLARRVQWRYCLKNSLSPSGAGLRN